MKKLLIGLLITLTLIALGTLVFSTEYASVDSLIRPPKIEGENFDIQEAFEAAVEKKYILKSPLSGEYRTSFIRTDLDNDNTDEVVVFYCYSDMVDVVRMNILDENNGVWESLADLESSYNDIHQVQFADVDNDNIKELIVCWQNFETEISNKLDVYKFLKNSASRMETIFSKNYYKFLVCDADDDSKTDIIIFEKNVTASSNEIKGICYSFDDSKTDVIGEFIVDPAISSIDEICFDRERDSDRLRIYIDGYKTDSDMTTDIFLWDSYNKHFERLEPEDSTSVSAAASRSMNINCKDINNDKYIDIPLEEYIPESIVLTGDSEDETLRQQAIIKWVEINDYTYELIRYEIFNIKYGYSLNIEGDHFGKFTVENDIENGTIYFYELLSEKSDPKKEKKPKKKDEPFEGPPAEGDFDRVSRKGELLFTVSATNKSDYGTYEFSGYKYIDSSNGFDYYCQITEVGKDYGITKEMIKSMFYI